MRHITIFLALVLGLLFGARLEAATAAEYQAAGNALVRQGEYQQALAQYDQSLSLNPNNPALKQYADQLRARLSGAAGSDGGARTVAVVDSEYTRAWLTNKGKDPGNIKVEVDGTLAALHKLGYSGAVLSDKDVESGKLMGYKAAFLPDSSALSLKEQRALAAFNAAGKGIVMVWGYGGFDESGLDQMDLSIMNRIFGVKFTGWQGDPQVGQGPFDQYFWLLKQDKASPVGAGLPDRILYAAGEANTVQLAGATSVYQYLNKDKSTLVGGPAVTAYDDGRGRAVFIGGYLTAQLGGTDPDTPKTTITRLLGGALRWVTAR